MRRQLHVEFKFYIHINMLLLQETQWINFLVPSCRLRQYIFLHILRKWKSLAMLQCT